MNINGIEWSEDDITLVEKFESILQKGFYCSGQEVVSLYNKLFNKRQPTTNCSSCLRNYISQMYTALIRAREQERKAEEELKRLEEENKPETKITKKKK